MKMKLLMALLSASLLLGAQTGFAAETNTAKAELSALVGKIQTKLREGKATEKDLEAELKEFDALLAKYKDKKTDDVANILMMKATLYLQVFDDNEKAKELIQQLKRDFPETKQGQGADKLLASIEKAAEAEKVQKSLVEGAQFPDFNEQDLDGKPLSISKFKGKVVLVDFWATWCGPCRVELPNVIKTYEKYHDKGFEVIGISLDQDKKKLTSFMADRDMKWPQYFDGLGWGNKLAQKYGVNSIPATFLLDGSGKIIGTDLRGEDLEKAVGAALAKK